MADQLIAIIQKLLTLTEQTLHKQAEDTLTALSEQDPQSFIMNLAQIAGQFEDDKVRVFAISHLRKRISKFSEQSFSNLWDRLTVQIQDQIKVGLFALLKSEKIEAVRNLTCDCIGELGGSLLEDKEAGNRWPQLIPMVWELFMMEDPVYLASGFKILVNLLTFASDAFDSRQSELALLFANGVKNPNGKVAVSCIQAIGAYVSIMDKKQTKEFQVLVPSMLEQFYKQTNECEDHAQTILEVFTDIAETEPKFLSSSFEMLFSTIWKVNMEDQKVETDLKHTGTEMLITLLQRLPQLARKNDQYISRLIEMIFKHMIEIEDEITDEWKHPAEGFNEDIEEDADFETTRFGMNAIDRLIDSIGDKEVLPILSATVQKLLEHSDWRYNFSAIMALSQVGEYIDDINTVKPIILMVLNFLQKENPMIRYSVFHAIGQISDDMKPSFQEEFKDTITPVILKYLDDPVPRVVSHAAAALTNFIEGFKEEEANLYLKDILLKLLSLVDSGCSIVKENCMTAIASTAEAAKKFFHPYYNEVMPLLFRVFANYPGKAYRQLRGQTIECITLIAHSVDKQIFLPHLQEITKIIVGVQNSTLESNDPQKSYVLSGWQRLSLQYSEELAQYLPEILPGVFNLITSITKSDNEDGCDVDEAEIALSMLEVFIDQFGKAFAPYVESATNIITPLCEFKYSDAIRQAASQCVPGLVKSAAGNPDIQKNMVRYFLGKLINATTQEYDSTVMITQISAMKDCIDSAGRFMTQDELDQLSEKVIKFLLDSDKRMQENEKWSKEADVDEDEVEIFEEDLEMEEDLQTSISDLLGVLYKTHKEQTIKLAELLFSQVLPKMLDASATEKMQKFGIFLIDDMVEHLGYELMATKWSDFATALKMFASDKSCKVRQAAVYGIGMFAINTPSAQFTAYAEPLVQALIDASKVALGGEKEKAHGHARDNSIASIGKIIKTHSIVEPQIISFWLNNLPLTFDKPEGHVQHAFLAEIVNSRPELISNSQELITKTINVFAQILDTKLILSETVPLVSQALKVLSQNQFVVNNFATIISSLNDKQKERLQKAFQA